MNDPLDAVFVTGDKAAELKRTDTARKLATYLERMPAELRSLFSEQFQHISSTELAQLRADLQAAQARIKEFESGDLVEALLEANQTQADIIIEQARQLREAYETAAKIAENCALRGAGTDRRYKVAMDIGRQLREIAANTEPQEQDDQRQSDFVFDWRKDREHDFARHSSD